MVPAHNVVDAVAENPLAMTIFVLLFLFVIVASVVNMVATARERKLRKAAEAALVELKRAPTDG